MRRSILIISGLALLALGVLLTVPAAEAQQPPEPTTRRLVNQRVEELPQGAPVCWNVFRFQAPPGFRTPTEGYGVAPIDVAAIFEGSVQVEYAGGPTVVAKAGEGGFIGQGNWRAISTVGATPAQAIVFRLTCARVPPAGGDSPIATHLGKTDVLPGIRLGPVPYQVRLLERTFAPGAKGDLHAHTGPVTQYVLEGTLAVSTSAGVSHYKAGDVVVISPGVPVQASNVSNAPARTLILPIWPAAEPLQIEAPGVRLPSTPPKLAQASVQLRDGSGAVVGSATLSEEPGGYVKIAGNASGLKAGVHGYHIHAVGKCEGPAFTSAGGHFNPGAKQHGFLNPAGPHAGDLPTLAVGADGVANLAAANERVTLSTGANTLFDADGSALVIHADPDDLLTDPTGNAGARVACGVIERAAAAPVVLPRTGDTLLGVGLVALLAGLALLAAGLGLRRARPERVKGGGR